VIQCRELRGDGGSCTLSCSNHTACAVSCGARAACYARATRSARPRWGPAAACHASGNSTCHITCTGSCSVSCTAHVRPNVRRRCRGTTRSKRRRLPVVQANREPRPRWLSVPVRASHRCVRCDRGVNRARCSRRATVISLGSAPRKSRTNSLTRSRRSRGLSLGQHFGLRAPRRGA